jgi:hypothetical protein
MREFDFQYRSLIIIFEMIIDKTSSEKFQDQKINGQLSGVNKI